MIIKRTQFIMLVTTGMTDDLQSLDIIKGLIRIFIDHIETLP